LNHYPSPNIIQSICLVGKGRLKERCGLEPRTNFFRLRNRQKLVRIRFGCGLDSRIYGITYSECVCMCFCSLIYPVSKAHAPYYIVVCALPVTAVFTHTTSYTARFSGEKLLNIKCVLIFSATFVRNISHSKKNSERYHNRNWVFMQSTRYSCQILMIFEFSRQIFEKFSNICFDKNQSSGSRFLLAEGGTNRQTRLKLFT
jgi:hypothetical protein